MTAEQREELAAATLGMIPDIPHAFLMKLKEEGADLESCAANADELNNSLGEYSGRRITQSMLDSSRANAESELSHCWKKGVKTLTIFSEDYPQLLAETADFPKVLFKYGDCDLNALPLLAVVGTRHCTAYGDTFVRQTIPALAAEYEPCGIVSGLAYGIDAAAHRAALACGLPTIAVVAHGFGTLYPADHRQLAAEICAKGGCLLTEYPWNERPMKGRFLERNRIVAGMTKVTLVVESAIKGGALSTATSAFRENRTVLALPGRVTDSQSAGCNKLIYQEKAGIAIDYETIASAMDLIAKVDKPVAYSKPIFNEPEGDAKILYMMLQKSEEPMPLDEICSRSGMATSKVMALLADMEFDSLIGRYPGNRFAIC